MRKEVSQKESLTQLTLWSEDSRSHVRISAWQDSARALMETEAVFGSSFIESWTNYVLACASSKTYPVYYPRTKEGISRSYFRGWSNSGIAWHGGFSTLVTLESPKDAVECSLSEVLVQDAAPKYYLSPKACAGILRRAEKRGKQLPEQLRAALENVAGAIHQTETGGV